MTGRQTHFRIGFFAMALAIVCIGCVTTVPESDISDRLETVPGVDLGRYVGRWYEIARFQTTFERNLVGVTAEYSLREDGRIRVINSGYKNTLNGKLDRIQGVAWVPNATEPGFLKVRFFWPFAGNYKIIGLDIESYEWAVVGDDSRQFLWLLARSHEIPSELYEEMRKIAEDQGFDTSNLYMVPQQPRQ